MKERKFLSDWKLTFMFSVLVWLFTFLEAGLTLSWISDLTLWTHNYMIFTIIMTFAFAFLYMRKLEDFVWYEEGAAFAVVFVLINLFLDYGILFLLLSSPIFNIQNAVLYVSQFLVCILASFVVKKKYIPA
ncbi:MAG: hypothetical protein KAT37_03730 [Candidatus Aenigmarchaeota archaeon]|nr:hypothetical protein [Candidatus Aenigmarchaeota archaeon]